MLGGLLVLKSIIIVIFSILGKDGIIRYTMVLKEEAQINTQDQDQPLNLKAQELDIAEIF